MLLALYLLAHSWYPPECCSDRDCEPVPDGSVSRVQGGYQFEGQFIPDATVRTGQDLRFHACKSPSGTLLCFFRPTTGA